MSRRSWGSRIPRCTESCPHSASTSEMAMRTGGYTARVSAALTRLPPLTVRCSALRTGSRSTSSESPCSQSATGDYQWIHVDPAPRRAWSFRRYGCPRLPEPLAYPGADSDRRSLRTGGARVNYGLDKVRFPSPVRSGSRVCAEVRSQGHRGIPAGLRLSLTYEVRADGAVRPACVAQGLTLLTRA